MTKNPDSRGIVADMSPDFDPEDPRRRRAQSRDTDSTVKKESPKSILALFEFAYREQGKKLNLARKALHQLPLQPDVAQREVDAIRRLGEGDPFLTVPPSLLTALAEQGAEKIVRERILDLVLEVLHSHGVFKDWLKRRTEDRTLAPVRQVIEEVRNLKFIDLGLQKQSDLTEAARERLRVNAVTTIELMSVLRGMSLDTFIDDLSEHIWKKPVDRNDLHAAAVLAAARNTDALHYLSQRFATRVQNCEAELERAFTQSRLLELRAIRAEAENQRLRDDLHREGTRSARLEMEIDDLKQGLAAEQSSRVVDRSHHVDNYEILRTQVIRRLTNQVELLDIGLHALRNGSAEVAEEFVDRALNAIGSEVKQLKEMDGETP